MRLVNPEVEIMHITPDALKLIERAGRVCYKSEDKITPDSNKAFIKMLLGRNHESVIEHAHVTFRVVTNRGVTHELVRHRIASFSQESTRYCDYHKGHTSFLIPKKLRDVLTPATGEDEVAFPITPPSDGGRVWLRAMRNAEELYRTLRNTGWKPEEARGVLPNDLKTEIVVTMNFRELRHFFRLRSSRVSQAAHPDMREVADMLYDQVCNAYLEVFEEL